MSQPAAGAGRRRGEERAAGGEAGRLQPFGPVLEHGTDLRRQLGILECAAAVALDEGDDDVLAAEPGQQLVAGRATEGVDGAVLGERLLVLQGRAYVVKTVVDDRAGVLGRHGYACDLYAEGHADHPRGPEHE